MVIPGSGLCELVNKKSFAIARDKEIKRMSVDIKLNTMSEQGKTAVVYARYSSHNQGEQSIEGQLDAAHKYASQKGYTIIKEYIDRAKTGRNDNREGFQKMLKDTDKKKFDVIIVWKVDRFGRNRQEINLNKARCAKNGVRVEYVAETIPDTDEGVILESVLEGFAEYFSRQLSRNVRRGQLESAQKCQSIGGTRPLGYQIGPDKKYVIDEEEASTVRLIFSLYANGKTLFEVIRHLNSLGLKTVRGNAYTKNSISALLKNERYRGVYTYKDMRIEGGMPRIIDDDTFFKVQEMLKVNKRTPATKWHTADYLLTDKLFCGKCGSLMVGESGTSRDGTKHCYYACVGNRKLKNCDKKAVKKDLIENIVIDHTLKMLTDDNLMEYIVERCWSYYIQQDEKKAEVDALKAELKDAQTAFDNLLKAVEQGMPFTPGVKVRTEELEQQIQTLDASIREREIADGYNLTKQHIAYFLYQYRDIKRNDMPAVKRMIKTFINSVYVFDDYITINYNFSSDTKTINIRDVYTNVRTESAYLCHMRLTKKMSVPETPIISGFFAFQRAKF